MFVIKYRKIFYAISLLLTVLSIASFSVFGLEEGIDFKGGSILEIHYPDGRPVMEEVSKDIEPLKFSATVRPTDEKGYIIRSKTLSEAERNTLVKTLSDDGKTKVEVKRFDTIGPILGEELKGKSIVSVILVLLAIVLFITYAFRKVSEPVSSWIYGLIAIVSLVHDVLVPTGVFALLGHYQGVEVDTLFVTALLVILGFSIHDTIVVFDRTRENLKINKEEGRKEDFEITVGKSVSQTFTRSINTSFTVILTLLVLYFMGPEATKNFSLALLIGIIAGTYSSIFLGSPLLVTIAKWQEKRASK
jgi:preprotein translocase subunit SecF